MFYSFTTVNVLYENIFSPKFILLTEFVGAKTHDDRQSNHKAHNVNATNGHRQPINDMVQFRAIRCPSFPGQGQRGP